MKTLAGLSVKSDPLSAPFHRATSVKRRNRIAPLLLPFIMKIASPVGRNFHIHLPKSPWGRCEARATLICNILMLRVNT